MVLEDRNYNSGILVPQKEESPQNLIYNDPRHQWFDIFKQLLHPLFDRRVP